MDLMKKVHYIIVIKIFNFNYYIISNFSFFLYVYVDRMQMKPLIVCKINKYFGYYIGGIWDRIWVLWCSACMRKTVSEPAILALAGGTRLGETCKDSNYYSTRGSHSGE